MKKLFLFLTLSLFLTSNASCCKKDIVLPGGVSINLDFSFSLENFLKHATLLVTSKNIHGATASAIITILTDLIIKKSVEKHKKKEDKKYKALPTEHISIILSAILGTYTSVIPRLQPKHMAIIAGSSALLFSLLHFLYRIIKEHIPIIHGEQFGFKRNLLNDLKQFGLNLSTFLTAYYGTPQLKKWDYCS